MVWLINKELLLRDVFCPMCDVKLHLVKRSSAPEGFVWQCRTSVCSKRRISVRDGSIFARSRLPIRKIMTVIYEWAKGGLGADISVDSVVARSTVVEWTLAVRMLIRESLSLSNRVIGGPGSIVEIDETLVFRRKYNVGRLKAQVWLFGGIVRGSNPAEYFMEVVPDRK